MEKEDYSHISYVLGVVSIVISIFSPIVGLVLGIIGLRLSKKQISGISKKARKLNIWGIIISIVAFLIYLSITLLNNLGYLPQLPGA